MNLKRSEFQVQELQRAVLDKQAGVHSSNNDVQLKIQISTLEAMNNELSGQLNEQKNARRMLEGINQFYQHIIKQHQFHILLLTQITLEILQKN